MYIPFQYNFNALYLLITALSILGVWQLRKVYSVIGERVNGSK